MSDYEPTCTLKNTFKKKKSQDKSSIKIVTTVDPETVQLCFQDHKPNISEE